MDNRQIVEEIDRLVDEEHQLTQGHAAEGLSAPDKERLAQIEVQLDQCWDLLRQRRARREFGGDPDDATLRSPSTVEGYRQ